MIRRSEWHAAPPQDALRSGLTSLRSAKSALWMPWRAFIDWQVAALVTCMALMGCGDEGDHADTDASAAAPMANEALALVVSWINGDLPSDMEYETHLDPSFTAQVSYQDFVEVLVLLAEDGPWETDTVEADGPTGLVARVTGPGGTLRVSLTIADAETLRIVTLLIEAEDGPMIDIVEF